MSLPPFKPSRLLEDADAIVSEYLTYRGFSNTLFALAQERRDDALGGLSTRKLTHRLAQAIELLQLKNVFAWWDESINPLLVRVDDQTLATSRWLQDATFRLYLVECVKQNKMDLVMVFIKDHYGARVLNTPFRNEWRRNWFALPFLVNPERDRYFMTFFSSEWRTSLFQSLENFLSTVFLLFPPPRLLSLATARDEIAALKSEITALRSLKSGENLFHGVETALATEHVASTSTGAPDRPSSTLAGIGVEPDGARDPTRPASDHPASRTNDAPITTTTTTTTSSATTTSITLGTSTLIAKRNSAINRVRFSPSYSMVAACGADATASVWSCPRFDYSPSFEQIQTLFCGSTAFSLDWLSEDILAVGTLDHVVRIWGLKSTSVPVSLKTGPLLPWILDVVHDPSNPQSLAVSAAPARDALFTSSARFGGEIQLWSIHHEKIDRILPIEPFTPNAYPTRFPTIKFNHNGSLLISAGSDGVIRMHDVLSKTGNAITGWRATHATGGVIGLGMNAEETSIYTVSSDLEIIEWSIHRAGEVVRKFHPAVTNATSNSSNNNALKRADVMASGNGLSLMVAPHHGMVFDAKTGEIAARLTGCGEQNVVGSNTTLDWGISLMDQKDTGGNLILVTGDQQGALQMRKIQYNL